jgi:hypothetical protein
MLANSPLGLGPGLNGNVNNIWSTPGTTQKFATFKQAKPIKTALI